MSALEDREADAREDAGWDALAARDEALTCESCFGEGITRDETACPECDGTGRIDPDAFESQPWEPRC